MKKKIIILVVVLLCILLIVSISWILVKQVYSTFSNKDYDYIVVGDNYDCVMFGKDKITYVGNNHKFKTIKKDYKQDYSNMYKITVGTETITYFPYDLWSEMYKSLGYMECNECIEYENVINEYLPKYEQKEQDKQVFDKIVKKMGKEKMFYIKYFIITNKNYFIFNTMDETIYKFNKKDDSLEPFLKTKTCDITYFYEKE